MTEENARFPRVDGFEGLNAAWNRAYSAASSSLDRSRIPERADRAAAILSEALLGLKKKVEQLERGEERLVEILLKRAATIGK